MRYIKLAFVALFVAAGVLFFIQNSVQLTSLMNLKVDLYFAKLIGQGVPVYAVVVGGFLVGIILGLVYFLVDKFHSSRQIRTLRKENKKLQEELDSLRNLPLEEDVFSSSSTADEQDSTLEQGI